MDIGEKIKKFLNEFFPDSEGFEEIDFLHTYGKFKDAVLYSILYMPELIEVDDHVLIKTSFSTEKRIEEFKEAINEPNCDVNEIEANFNLVEVSYKLCDYSPISFDDEELLTYRIRDAWDGWLKVQYPEREFLVKIEEIPNDDGHYVFFHEKRDL